MFLRMLTADLKQLDLIGNHIVKPFEGRDE